MRLAPARSAALALLITLVPATPPTAKGAAPVTFVPFELRANKVILPVTLPGVARPLRIILDTGMAQEGLLLFDAALLDSTTRRRAARARIGGAGAGPGQEALLVDSASFRVGEARFDGRRIVALGGPAMREGPSDGVCGLTLFARHAVELDYGRMRMGLHPPGGFRPAPGWFSVPLRFRGNRIPWLDVTASVSAPDSVRLECYVDLASSETIEFLTREGAKFSVPEGLEEVVLGRGLGGDIPGRRGSVAWVRLGPASLEGVVAAFTPAGVRSKQPGADAVLGNGLLRRFDCVFDYAGQRLYLRPNAGFG